jgi:hypothetical protein
LVVLRAGIGIVARILIVGGVATGPSRKIADVISAGVAIIAIDVDVAGTNAHIKLT